jgi:hypothetical protein
MRHLAVVSANSARRENRRAAAASRRTETSTSMTCPCWPTARHTYRHPVDLHVRLVHELPVARRAPSQSCRVGPQRSEPLRPTSDRDVIDLGPQNATDQGNSFFDEIWSLRGELNPNYMITMAADLQLC